MKSFLDDSLGWRGGSLGIFILISETESLRLSTSQHQLIDHEIVRKKPSSFGCMCLSFFAFLFKISWRIDGKKT